jgi:hypothetical protein
MGHSIDYRNWETVVGKLIIMYPELTKADLIRRHNSINDLLETIASKLGKTAKELQSEVEEF